MFYNFINVQILSSRLDLNCLTQIQYFYQAFFFGNRQLKKKKNPPSKENFGKDNKVKGKKDHCSYTT